MNKLIRNTGALACLAAAMAAGSAYAQTTTGSSTGSTSAMNSGASGAAMNGNAKVARADASFMKDAAHAGATEIEGSKLALQKAQSADVKTFAQQMIDDHTKASDELKQLAASKGVELPSDPSLAQKAKIKLLSTSDGASFDKRYADSIGVSAHKDTVKLFQKAANSARDPEVKAFATKTLPTLQHHLDMAQSLKSTTMQASSK